MNQPLPLEELRAQVQTVLDRAHAHHTAELAPIGPEMDALIAPINALLRGGKRLRAAFCYWGYRAAGGRHDDAIVQVATAMEVFQAAALLHDDVMDRSDTRRGMPTAHRTLAALHREHGWDGESDRFGEAAAILAGDLCLNWTDELYSTSGLPADELARGRVVFDRMRTQLMGGQYLDVLESVRPWESASTQDRIERARLVIRYKSAKYTVEQPLLIGATAFGVDADTESALSEYGLALGEAFQLRDDLLGVYGDPEATGKPAGDDLREGKRTVLIALALDNSSAEEVRLFNESFGRDDLDDDGIGRLRDWITASGAVERVEQMITDLSREAGSALDRADLDPEGEQMLRELIGIAVARAA
ncbi:geranylgeranyl diphosphate synthase type I [Yimella lutea]|uniref:Geranylgeranyl diphosphate synthase type I n=1 Tax=Yimella lutea TaxID=587872 RepID=A0A542EG12_9MICO|nr:polyprenyl synthetase family protein [Yimella lutea]TQJ14255.1 geranylgeranyl diphosphate synthase type I [Yimella lutea]